MAVSTYDDLKPVIDALNDAIYAALDACDDYQTVVQRHIAEQNDSGTPNHQLVSRLGQFDQRVNSIVATIEDSVLNDLNFLNHRMFAVDLTEKGTFI